MSEWPKPGAPGCRAEGPRCQSAQPPSQLRRALFLRVRHTERRRRDVGFRLGQAYDETGLRSRVFAALMPIRALSTFAPSLSCPPFSKYRSAHTDYRRTLNNRHPIIVAHTHRKLRQRKTRFARQPVAQLSQRNKIAPRMLGRWPQRRNCHQSLDVSSLKSGDRLNLLEQFIRRKSKFGCFPSNVDLQQNPRKK